MENVRSICVFCGSRMGADAAFERAAERLGSQIAERGLQMVYGGGGIGLMGVVAHAAASNGARVIGVIPRFLTEYEVGHVEATEYVVVESMHARKNRMFELSDAFVALPGGIGTLDETIEITTWKQLQLHAKPIVLVNQDGYWDPFVALLERTIDGGFAHPKVRDLVTLVDSVDGVFDAIANAPQPDRVVLTSHL